MQYATSNILWLLLLHGIICNETLAAQVRYNLSPTPVFGGKGHIYFNGTADSAYASPGNTANGNENLEQRVIDAVNNARKSIDLAAFELNSLNIVVALCQAKVRGVRVRIIFDDESAPNNNKDLWKVARSLLQNKYQIPMLSDAGWPAVKSKKNFYKGRSAFMHNKFLVTDYLTADSTDDVVITGSYNFTITGMVSMQNVIKVQNRALARAYTEEFETMWGGTGETPDTLTAAFHQYKKKSSNAKTLVGAKSRVEAYFAPMSKDKSRPSLLEIVADLISKEADHDIKICAFSFSTGVEIDEAIREKFELKNLDLKAVFDKTGRTSHGLYSAMTLDSISRNPWAKKAEAFLAHEDRQLHHKYILIDAENPDTEDIPVLITGSFNFSKNANEANDDNFLVIYDRQAANQFLQEFYARFNSAKKHALRKSMSAEVESENEDVD
ncbi:hypothetical protein JNM05_09310 [bacterium]|nr:hypothetical protein [bacterium]